MMQSLRPSYFDASRGIAQIDRNSLVPMQLPDGPMPNPAEISEPAKLQSLLAMPSLDDYIARCLRPALLDTSILAPARFRLVLTETAASLKSRARQNPKAAKRLGHLALLLDEEQSLLELLQMYRSALLQG